MSLATVPVPPVLEIQAIEVKPTGYRRRTVVESGAAAGGILFLLSMVAILIDGYHPYSEDAGIYVASLKKLAYPALYPASGAFLAPYVKLSLFSHFGAWLLLVLHLPIEAVLFVMHLATTWLLLLASYGLARRCFRTRRGHWGAALLMTLCLSVPVAGTSLSMMDPYLTGRSFATPFALLGFCAVLDRRPWRALAFMLLAVLFHPLMGAYAIGFSLVLWAVHRRSWFGVAAIAVASLMGAAAIQISQAPLPETAAYRAAVATRYYFFLSEWQWYEILGLVAPLCLLAFYGLWKRNGPERGGASLAMACVAAGLISCSASLLFCHLTTKSYLLASLQPLRPFLYIYCAMFVLIGGLLGEIPFNSTPWGWSLAAVALGLGLASVQHSVYPESPQLELPGLASPNPWHRAFNWIRSNSASDAITALDADYIHAPGEDSLGFRAVAERDSLADRSKDGGAAAVFPQLAERWLLEQTATTDLNRISDAERLRRLTPFHVSWVVLNGDSATNFTCPFQTATVKVCRLQ